MTNKRLNLKFEFRHLLLAAAIVTYIVIVLGVLTRVTAGGGCPDWPTCYGSWTAPVQSSAMLDYVHRLATVLAGALGFAALIWVWRQFRISRLIFISLLLSALAFGAEIVVSAASVLNLLPTALESSLHLGLALLIFGLQLVAVSAAFQLKIPARLHFRSPFARLSLITLLAVFVLLISGTLVSVTGATAYCEGWPLCDPQGALGWLNLGHRAIVGVTSIIVFGFCSEQEMPPILSRA